MSYHAKIQAGKLMMTDLGCRVSATDSTSGVSVSGVLTAFSMQANMITVISSDPDAPPESVPGDVRVVLDFGSSIWITVNPATTVEVERK